MVMRGRRGDAAGDVTARWRRDPRVTDKHNQPGEEISYFLSPSPTLSADSAPPTNHENNPELSVHNIIKEY